MHVSPQVGRALRALGYPNTARDKEGKLWEPTKSDLSEVDRFRRDYERAFGCVVRCPIDSPDFFTFVDNAKRRESEFDFFRMFGSASCCLGCHFAEEEAFVIPHLSDREAKGLLEEHEELRAYMKLCKKTPELFCWVPIEQHAKREMALFREARVPPDILRFLDHDHGVMRTKYAG